MEDFASAAWDGDGSGEAKPPSSSAVDGILKAVITADSEPSD